MIDRSATIVPSVQEQIPVPARVRRAVGALRQRVAGPPPEPTPAPGPPPADYLGLDLRERAVPLDAIRPRYLATELVARLTDDQRGQIRRAAASDEVPGLLPEDNPSFMFQACAAALYLGLPGVEEATGLSSAMPPPDVHAMDHSALGAGGDVYTADLVDDAFTQAGAPLQAVETVLDFGCSSGRVVRVLAAARPEIRFLGCDPNGPAIAWAQQHLPKVGFHRSETDPPLSFIADGELDAAFAISIWSHFDAGAALAWLDEMHRAIRPGGHLLLTTHGWESVAWNARRETDVTRVFPIAQALYREGFMFYAAFDEATGDWGVRSTGWGMAFLTPEWLVSHVTPKWTPRLLWPGANAMNQDVWILERR
jgi:SAM-dependent methyltransferase